MKSIVEGTPYVSKRFQNDTSTNLLLKLFVTRNQFQFLITDSTNTILYLHPFELNGEQASFFQPEITKEITTAIENLNKEFSSVSVGIFTPDFTLVPNVIKAEMVEGFFRQHLLNNSESTSEILYDHINEINGSLIFSAGKELMQSLQEKFPMFAYQHSCSAQIRNLSPRNQALNVYAIIQSKWIQVICLSGHQLKFANAFPFKTAEDFIYYVIAVYRLLDLNPENVPLILFGEVIRDSTVYQAAVKYVRHVKLGKASSVWKFEDDYPFPLHFYSTLLSL